MEYLRHGAAAVVQPDTPLMGWDQLINDLLQESLQVLGGVMRPPDQPDHGILRQASAGTLPSALSLNSAMW